MANTRYPGKDLHFAIENAAGASQVLTGVTSVSGLPGETEHYDATAVGDAGRKHVAGLENVTVTVEGWYDTTSTTGSAVVLSGLAAIRNTDNTSAIIFGPYGSTTGFEKFTATVKMKTLEYPAALGDLVKFRTDLLVQGAVTHGTF
jgi:hypothetical protein|tara:strand:- start:5000 stop:5437 length:438 start_codon:yes stop_codon:yes gene_type:complete